MPIALLSALAAGIITCFAPEQDCARLAIGAVDAATHEILVNAYVLTMGSGLPAALIRAIAAASTSASSPTAGRPAICSKASTPPPRPASRSGSTPAPGSPMKRR